MKSILYVVGPTATGKTNLALYLAKNFDGELISADSRQIYQFLNIGTGKDIPENSIKKTISLSTNTNKVTYYQTQNTKIWGYDLISPTLDFSVSQYKQFADLAVKDILKRNKLPIIVGGTGFYLNCIQNSPKSISIPQNLKLRKKLQLLTTQELQEQLIKINKPKFDSLNQSDANNPRRLIRSIEISKFQNQNPKNKIKKSITDKLPQLWVGLDASISQIDKLIENRVLRRIKDGFEKEFDYLTENNLLKSHSQAASATGYKQWFIFKSHQTNKNEALKLWITAEKQYARRQKTWFKKQKNIIWFNSNSKKLNHSVVDYVKNWYSKFDER